MADAERQFPAEGSVVRTARMRALPENKQVKVFKDETLAPEWAQSQCER